MHHNHCQSKTGEARKDKGGATWGVMRLLEEDRGRDASTVALLWRHLQRNTKRALRKVSECAGETGNRAAGWHVTSTGCCFKGGASKQRASATYWTVTKSNVKSQGRHPEEPVQFRSALELPEQKTSPGFGVLSHPSLPSQPQNVGQGWLWTGEVGGGLCTACLQGVCNLAWSTLSCRSC